jgi:hypothetical protein
MSSLFEPRAKLQDSCTSTGFCECATYLLSGKGSETITKRSVGTVGIKETVVVVKARKGTRGTSRWIRVKEVTRGPIFVIFQEGRDRGVVAMHLLNCTIFSKKNIPRNTYVQHSMFFWLQSFLLRADNACQK